MARELECKIRIGDCAPVAAKLLALGAELDGEAFERNWTFDTPTRELYQSRRLLRLRTWDGREGGLVTVKCPPVESAFKSREEVEFAVADPGAFEAAMTALGYERAWYYEKFRQTWTYWGCEAALDELPCIGSFLEVEGPDEATIHTVLDHLGINAEGHTQLSYRGLYETYCKARGEEVGALRFAAPIQAAKAAGDK